MDLFAEWKYESCNNIFLCYLEIIFEFYYSLSFFFSEGKTEVLTFIYYSSYREKTNQHIIVINEGDSTKNILRK